MKLFFFKIPKNRVFNYRPRYYDADKDELQERVQKIEEGLNPKEESEFKINRERVNFRKAYSELKRNEKKSPYKRLLTFVAILLFVVAAYFVANNFAYLLTPSNYEKPAEQRVNPDWTEDTQIVIVDDDEGTTENTDE